MAEGRREEEVGGEMDGKLMVEEMDGKLLVEVWEVLDVGEVMEGGGISETGN